MKTTKPKLNFLLITVDSLRADYFDLVSSKSRLENTSCPFGKWATNSVVFSRAITQSSHTSPCCLALLSGNYPSKYGDWYSRFADDRPMMAEIFKSNGYYTYAFNSNPYISHYCNFDRGFDIFQDNMPKFNKKTLTKKFLANLSKIKSVLNEPYENAEKINNQVISQISSAQKPFFMWAHYMDVHGPYISKKGWSTKNRLIASYLWKKALKSPEKITPNEKNIMISSYKEEINYCMHSISELLNNINLDDTIIIFTADHGDMFGENNLYGHSRMLYNGVLHVPLIIKHPEFNAQNIVINTPVRILDILPTITSLLKLDTDCQFDGNNLSTLVDNQGDTVSNDEYVIAEISRKHLCVEKSNWKLIVNYANDKKELYDLNNDIKEANNVASSYEDIVNELELIIQNHLERNKPRKSSQIDLKDNEEMQERLKSLGYM